MLPALLLTTLFVSSLFAATAHAADASWKNKTTVTYDGKDWTAQAGDGGTRYYSGSSGGCADYITVSGDKKSGQFVDRGLVAHVGCSTTDTVSLTFTNTPDGDGGAGDGSGGDSSEELCDAGAFGWVLCPVTQNMSDVIMWITKALDAMLRVQPLSLNTNSPLYKVWSNIQNIANILLIIVFLVIVFSQATSYGLSNYGVKRMIPRLLAAAILINVSYFICAVMIDISNLAGAGVSGLFLSAIKDVGAGNASYEQNIGNFFQNMGALIGAAVFVWFLLIPVILSLLAIFLVIAARIGFLTILTILSPLAFAAWVLPNTEKYFRKWWEYFLQMLIFYPMIMAVFSGAVVAANILDITVEGEGSAQDTAYKLIPLIVLISPLFALPAIIKISSGILGRLDNMTRAGMMKYGGNWANDRAREARGMATAAAANRFGRRADGSKYSYEGDGKFGRTRSGIGRAIGFAATGKERRMAWDKRVKNADKMHEARFQERMAGDANSAARKVADAEHVLDERAGVAGLGYRATQAEHIVNDPNSTEAGLANERFVNEQRATQAGVSRQRDLAQQLHSDEQNGIPDPNNPGGRIPGRDSLLYRAGGVQGDAGRRRILSQANATLMKEQTEEQRQRHEAVESAERMMGANHALKAAWAHTQGGSWNDQYVQDLITEGELGQGDKQIWDELKAAGMDRRAESFDAAVRGMANSGYGKSPETLARAFQKMDQLGYQTKDLADLSEYTRSTYRNKGRGDMVARVPFDPALQQAYPAVQALGARSGFGVSWGEIKPEAISRHALKDPAQQAAFIQHLQNPQDGAEYTRGVVMKLDNLQDERARPKIIDSLEKAYAGETRPDGTKYTAGRVVEQLRDDFALNPGGGRTRPVASAGTQQSPPTPPGGGGGQQQSGGQQSSAPTPPPAPAPQQGTWGGSQQTAPIYRPPADVGANRSSGQRYTAPYSNEDMQVLGIGGMQQIVSGAGGIQNLSRGDIEKIANAVANHPSFNDPHVQDFHRQLNESLGSQGGDTNNNDDRSTS